MQPDDVQRVLDVIVKLIAVEVAGVEARLRVQLHKSQADENQFIRNKLVALRDDLCRILRGRRARRAAHAPVRSTPARFRGVQAMTTVIRKDVFSDTSALVSPWTHILSDETIDAYDDVIRQAGWEFGAHDANPVVLLAHNSQEPPIGRLTGREVRDRKLCGRIELALRGTSQFIDELRALMGLDGGGPNILRGVSVGFFPLEARPRAGSTKGGTEFLRQRLAEVSICSIPANPSALAIARSLKISRGTMARVFSGGNTISAHIAEARAAVTRERKIAETLDKIQMRVADLWVRYAQAMTQAEQQALLKQIETLERSEAVLTPPERRTADQKLKLRLDTLKAEQARNDPYGIEARGDSERPIREGSAQSASASTWNI
jgi:hypothetical protein